MKRQFTFVVLAVAFVLVANVEAHAFQKVPSWLQQAAALTPPSYEKTVPAVALHREKSVTLENSSKLVTIERSAIKVLTREGRREAVGIAFYLSKFSQVRDIEAWLIAPGGSIKTYGNK